MAFLNRVWIIVFMVPDNSQTLFVVIQIQLNGLDWLAPPIEL
jgi:hypothetical protein